MTMKITITNEDTQRTAMVKRSNSDFLISIAPEKKEEFYIHRGCSITVSEREEI